jgi:hypothetical protein
MDFSFDEVTLFKHLRSMCKTFQENIQNESFK